MDKEDWKFIISMVVTIGCTIYQTIKSKEKEPKKNKPRKRK